MIRWMLIAAFAAAPLAAAQAQDKPAADAAEKVKGEPPRRIRNVLLFGEEKCPAPKDPDEIVVCSKGGDQYRIPKELRERIYSPTGQSWVRRVEVIEEVNRAGLPNSCSAIGSGGQTGCTAELLRQWAAEQADKKRAAGKVP